MTTEAITHSILAGDRGLQKNEIPLLLEGDDFSSVLEGVDEDVNELHEEDDEEEEEQPGFATGDRVKEDVEAPGENSGDPYFLEFLTTAGECT